MSNHEEIAARVKETLRRRAVTQAVVAQQVGMTTDQMSRAVNAQRGFSSIELASIADVLSVDVYWLITGQEDPLGVRIAARHVFDPTTGGRSNPGRPEDEAILRAVENAYRQAYPNAEAASDPLPDTPAGMREKLGPDFVRDFADRAEDHLDVDVVRIQGLSTAYSFTIGGRNVVLLSTTGNWFFSNWSLAHELAHLALGHHDVTDWLDAAMEEPANRFAAELLMPESSIRDIDWTKMGRDGLARFLWEAGVSCEALGNRLRSLHVKPSSAVAECFAEKTIRVLRRQQHVLGDRVHNRGPFLTVVDPIDERFNDAAARRFPQTLVSAHRKAIESGRLAPKTLAWMLESDLQDVVEELVPPSSGSIDDLLGDLGR